MTERPLTLVHSCELELVRQSAHAKVKVELLTGARKSHLHILERNKDTLLETINTDKIGALAIIKLGQKNLIGGKKTSRRCLVLFWRQTEAEQWNHLAIIDKEKAKPFNCVKQLKGVLAKLCFLSLFSLTDDTGHTHELQFTRRYIAIVPSDGNREIELTSLPEFSSSLTLDSIFKRSTNEIGVLQDRSSDSSSDDEHSLTLRTVKGGDERTSMFTVDNDELLVDIIREFASTLIRNPVSSLPPLPHKCGSVPPIDERPFWIPAASPIYGNLRGYQYETEVRLHEKRRREICQRELSVRLSKFVQAVNIVPDMMETFLRSEHEDEDTNRLYDIPRLSVNLEPVIPATEEFHQDNVEATLASYLKKIVQNTFHPVLAECPIGMTKVERECFCLRLDLLGYNTVCECSWKTFADHVMLLDNDDLRMFDEFSCRYKCQVVEVILDHWYKLYSMRSTKCKKKADKQTIVEVLNEMGEVDLLHHLKWQHK